jgi:hypothetical protein
MFELGILGIILLAVGYWATLWTMGRREDVLHGKFVEVEPAAAAVEPAPALQGAPRPSAESLQSLLATIKQDLQDAARM